MFRCVAFEVLLGLTAVGFGQIDPAAKPFLENVAVGARVPVRSLDYTICSISHEERDDTETCVRTASDFANQRFLVQTGFGDEAVTEMVYTDGQARTRDPVSGKPTVRPEDQTAIIKRSYNYISEMVRTGGALPDTILCVTYDGVRSYGNVVSGEQVTAEVIAASFFTGSVTPREMTMRFVFRDDQKLLALVIDVFPEQLMLVLADPVEPVLMRRMLSGSVYWLRGGKPVLAHTQRLTRYRLNPKLEDALFTFGNGEAAAATSSGKRVPAKTPR